MCYGANANNGSVAAAKSTLEQLRESGKEGGEARGEQAWLGILLVFASRTGRPTSYQGKYGFLFESTRGYFAELYAYCWMETRKRFLISIAAPEKKLSLPVRKLAEGIPS